ncbi:MAG: benzoate-CoA ligase family protein [SAR324 cluster bacterium]|nr:benzoate-CoA ligase family protein [SAR324 cluster bacterium]
MSSKIDLPQHFNIADYYILPKLPPERAERPYLLCGEESLSFSELHKGTNRVGHALKRLGVAPEQRVMLLLLESLNFPICFWGAIRIGAVAVPVNTLLMPKDYLYFLNDSRAQVLIVDAALWPQIEPIADELTYQRHIVIANGSVPGKPTLDELLAPESEDLEVTLMTPDDQAFWLYTSGSTGPPKASVHLHHDMVYCTELFAKPVLGLREDDLGFSAAKFFFAYGLGNSLYFPLVVGGRAVIQPGRPTPELIFETMARHRPTIFYGVPTLFNAMLNTYEGWLEGKDAPAELPTLDHLRFSFSAGESLPPEIYQRWKKHFGTEILDGIGSTELLHVFVSNRLGEVRPGSTGRVVPGYEARLVDEHGADVPDGEVGALLVKGDSASPYYWNKHEKSKSTMLGEWMVTGDQFHRDAEGYYWYHGRNDDMMKVSGSWVSPIEVENALLTHEAVAECAVVGRNDDAGLTKPKAFVVLREGRQVSDSLAEAMRNHVAESIPSFKAPHWVEFVDDLPKTATGKIRRFELRD